MSIDDTKTSESSKFYLKTILQEQHCKFVAKTLKKLQKRSLCAPLIKALSTESTFINDHHKRLLLIKKLFPVPNQVQSKAQSILLKCDVKVTIKKKSPKQDIAVIKFTTKLFQAYNKKLRQLKITAISYGDDLLLSLIEQTVNENIDTINWLKQIRKNVVEPIISENLD